MWQAEVVRYAVHGILHLLGHDDSHLAARRDMKRAEDRCLRSLASRFPLTKLARRRAYA
jgi:ssRNA-specific RNase YbeY (16S rRNA maturation enzyme)